MVLGTETRSGRVGYSIGEIVFQTQEIVLREFAFPRQLLHDGLRTFNTIPLHVADGVEYEIVWWVPTGGPYLRSRPVVAGVRSLGILSPTGTLPASQVRHFEISGFYLR